MIIMLFTIKTATITKSPQPEKQYPIGRYFLRILEIGGKTMVLDTESYVRDYLYVVTTQLT